MQFKFMILCTIFFAILACSKTEDPTPTEVPLPTNLTLNVNVSMDGSGTVNATASADNAVSYAFFFGLGSSETPVRTTDGNASYSYELPGSYTVTVRAFNSEERFISASETIQVTVAYDPPQALVDYLTGGDTKKWIWEKNVQGHLGVGPADGSDPIWYQANAFEKESLGCLYNDTLVFTLNGDNVQYQLLNNGMTYFNRGEVNDFLGQPDPDEDACYDLTTSVEDNSLVFYDAQSSQPTTSNVAFTMENNGFMSYFLGTSDYEILSYGDDVLVLRTIQTDPMGDQFAWYMRFIDASKANFSLDDIEYELVWEDEFDVDGKLDSTYWTYEIGTGQDGWGNQEKQYYTDRLENAEVKNGMLTITAKSENFEGSAYTSARVITKDKYEFRYGKIEFRAKLPKGRGTWPALWLLGHNIDLVSWPACGEIDVMEHVGKNQDVIQAALHTPSSFGDTQNKGAVDVPGVSEDFHLYSVEWSEDLMVFRVDDEFYYIYNPAEKNASTYPFNKNFFIIMNVAMGGSFGGTIDSNFSSSSMVIDFVKVYKPK